MNVQTTCTELPIRQVAGPDGAVGIRVSLVTPDQLTPDHLGAWVDFQRNDPSLESPYFRPEFTQAVAAVRGNVEVAVLEQAGDLVGFLPFQRMRGNRGRPVGGRLSDYQGIIGRRGLAWDATQLVRDCNLSVWDFDHLLVTQRGFEPHHRAIDLSPYLDLTNGFDGYRNSLGKSGADELRQTMRKARKLAREVGPLRFEPCSHDEEAFRRLVEWKSAQYQRTRVTDVFSFPWTVQLLERILDERGEALTGMMSALYAGDQLVSVHLGLRSFGVLHWWFPTYDIRFADYSPGRILLGQLAQAAAQLGIRRIDLGRGLADYKRRAMSGATQVAEGSVDLRRLARRLRQGWRTTRDWLRSSPLRRPLRVPGRVIHQIGEWVAFN